MGCPLKLKKMADMHRDGKRIVACSACAVAQNQRTRMNVDCGRRTYCVIYGTQERNKREKKKKKKKKKDFHYSEICIIIQIS